MVRFEPRPGFVAARIIMYHHVSYHARLRGAGSFATRKARGDPTLPQSANERQQRGLKAAGRKACYVVHGGGRRVVRAARRAGSLACLTK